MPAAGPQLVHMVYFTLLDRSPAARQQLLDSGHKYLSDHPGVLYFSIGTRVADLARAVNDQEFDVSLNVVFQSRQAHDDYQASPRHLAFVAENKPTWAKVRVFDSVSLISGSAPRRSPRPAEFLSPPCWAGDKSSFRLNG